MINLNKKTIQECEIQDATYAFNQAILNAKDGETINIEKGEYDTSYLFAFQHFCFMSNNDYSLKNMLFPIMNKKNITIDGNGSKLNCIGGILPFYICNSENITIKNFEIDYKRPFFTQGEVIETAKDYCVLKVDKNEFPYMIKCGIVVFNGEGYESDFVHGMLEWNKDERRPVANAVDNSVWTALKGEETKDGNLKIFHEWKLMPTVGNVLTIKHERRYYPAIAIDESDTVNLSNIYIKQAGTMGVVAQFSKDITLNKVDIKTDENSNRVMSADADATHFVNCRGTVTVENSSLYGQLDDIINVHGNYFRLAQVIDNKNVIVEIPHRQQVGVFGIKNGARVSICNKNTMLSLGETQIEKFEEINIRYYKLTFKTEFDFKDDVEYCIDDVDAYPAVIFRNNDCGKNRARGLLLTTSKDILVENNIIDTEGSAIKVNGDMHNWYESTNMTKLTIRGNKIRRRNQKTWGVALIDIDPGMKQEVQGEYFHGDIIIENNEFVLEEAPFFYGYSFNSVEVKNNKFIDTTNTVHGDDSLSMKISNCGKVIVENNEYTQE